MNKTVGIYCGILSIPDWNEESLETGIGGSETWAAETARELQKLGYKVTIYAQPAQEYIAPSGVEYLRADKFATDGREYDYFIFSRLLEGIEKVKCPKIYVMAHDLDFVSASKLSNLAKISGLAVLSDFQKNLYAKKYNYSRFLKVSNGVRPELYQDWKKYEKKNQMVWSSCPDRCLQYFLKYVFPEIKKAVPDFTLKVCSYVDIPGQQEIPGVEYLGHLGKQELAKIQKESKIWVYPNLGYLENPDGSVKVNGFHETFCITAVENAFAGNTIITFSEGALPETLSGYPGVLKGHLFQKYDQGFGILPAERYEIAGKLLAAQAELLLTDQERFKEYQEKLQEVCSGYTWADVTKAWDSEFKNPAPYTPHIPSLSVCLIVKDEEENIKRCLESLTSFADEICVLDTGSTDKTVEICKSIPKVKVQETTWRNDFAWARNISFSMATSEYVMWVDADDCIPEKSQAWIKELKESGELEFLDIVYFPYVYLDLQSGKDYFDFSRDRIYRASLKPVWYGRIHEYILPRSGKTGPMVKEVTREEAEILHYHKSPGRRNLDIFIDMEKIGEVCSGREWYYYGKEWYESGQANYESAIFCFKKALDSGTLYGSDKTNALQLMAKSQKALGRRDEAFQTAISAIGTTSVPRADICCLLGDYYAESRQYVWAKFWYTGAIDNRLQGQEDTFCERMYYTWYPRYILGNIYTEENNLQEAEKYYSEAIQINPGLDYSEDYKKKKEEA